LGAGRVRALGVSPVARLAPMLGDLARQGTQHVFGGSSSSHARRLGTIRLLGVTSPTRRAPMLGDWTHETMRHISCDSSNSHAWMLGSTGHLACFRRIVWLPRSVVGRHEITRKIRRRTQFKRLVRIYLGKIIV
jgi:hypothetical protein